MPGAFGATRPSAAPWLWPQYGERFDVIAENLSGADMWDALVVAPWPAEAGDSYPAVVNTDAEGFARSLQANAATQRLPDQGLLLPADVRSGQLFVRVVGRWEAGAARRFAAYLSPTDLGRGFMSGTAGSTIYKVLKTGAASSLVLPNFKMGIPLGGTVSGFAAIGSDGAGEDAMELFQYKLYGDATAYGATAATIASSFYGQSHAYFEQDLTFKDRGGVDFAGSLATRLTPHAALLPTNNDPSTLIVKGFWEAEYDLTLTLLRSFAAEPPGWHALLNKDVQGVTDATYQSLAKFYREPGGAITEYTGAGGAVSSPIIGTVFGHSNSGFAYAQVLDDFSVSDALATALGAPTAAADWRVDWPTTGSHTVPVGGVIRAHGRIAYSRSGATPAEATAILDYESPAVEIGPLQRRTSRLVNLGMDTAKARVLSGATRRIRDAGKWTSLGWNLAYSFNRLTATQQLPDDDDGTYPLIGYGLSGLCLLYKLDPDASLVPIIERYVDYAIQLEAAAQAQLGASVAGMMPYWVWMGPGTKATTNYAGTGFTLNVGDVDPRCSQEQLQHAAFGLWSYAHLLPNDGTFNRRDAVLALLSRMEDFEENVNSVAGTWFVAGGIPAYNRIIGNIRQLLAGAGVAQNNGMDTTHSNIAQPASIANPFLGAVFTQWLQNNGTSISSVTVSANTASVNMLRGLFAPNSTLAGIQNYLHGAANDMLLLDASLRDVRWTGAAGYGTAGGYPPGWQGKAGASTLMYDGTNGHYITQADGGYRDGLLGRTAQRAAIIAMCALYDPAYRVKVDATTDMPVLDALDATLTSVAAFIDRSGFVALENSGWFGAPGYADDVMELAASSYLLFALAVRELVQQRSQVTLSEFYPYLS